MRGSRMVMAITGAVFAGFGIWAFLDPSSFYSGVAQFPPFNAHLIRDIGAFQVGVGAALLLPLAWRDGALVGLGAGTVAATVHAASHVIDVERGGEPVRDLLFLWALAAVLMAATILRWRRVGR